MQIWKQDVELRTVQPQWKNSRVGDEAVLMSGRERTPRKKIARIHRESLARLLKDINYKRIFSDVKTIFEANGMVREIHPEDKEFMASELV